jgi:hypothetical protein
MTLRFYACSPARPAFALDCERLLGGRIASHWDVPEFVEGGSAATGMVSQRQILARLICHHGLSRIAPADWPPSSAAWAAAASDRAKTLHASGLITPDITALNTELARS